MAAYSALLPKKIIYHYTVRFADGKTEPFDIIILPRNGQNETHAINGLRDTLQDTKSYRASTPVLIIPNGTSEEG